MKTLLASIIIGLLAMSPVFAQQGGMGHGQTETQQSPHMQQEGMTGQPGQHGQTDQDRTYVQPQVGMERDTDDLISMEDLRDAEVRDRQDQNVGSIEKVLINQQGNVEKVVVEVDDRKVALDFHELNIQGEGDDVRINVQMSKEELKNKPEYQDNNN
ncbi:PRC-barrel domain-containing protein [Desulfonatronum thiosulfatophilum]|uniref:PRC-barrel domain-containing protein n=1 Tax=Desulfonatronum thiosulfatophilum TaxID=617002 RepID=A0A1G6CKS7_9BACT|nr:PRC-barrel domain-containing protein [Desulfonatronum thiosulfatophilum]SDB33352.1 PRC-barrel domain-containing protein [Desulfonatronum thiosulfatophilum]